jgi:hypothetical protein
MFQRLAEEAAGWEGGSKPTVPAGVRAKDFSALDVIKFGKQFSDQLIHQCVIVVRHILLMMRNLAAEKFRWACRVELVQRRLARNHGQALFD